MAMTSNERRIAGANIRRLRLEWDISLTKLAEEVEIERTYFHDIERGTANPAFEKYERIAEYFGKTVRDLLTERKERNGKGRKELTGDRRP